jgi:hypothetical protein
MQMELLLEPEIVASPVITDLSQVTTGLTRMLSTALTAMHTATTADRVLNSVAPAARGGPARS